tara:strand:- start:24451 stop:25530 length:1080 start_codon:yes stop_codon:yes gene_type:complete
MSSLLEQAIIDANDLRAAALKNAETAILERYSAEVKSAVDSLLEQPISPEEEMIAMATEPDDLSMDPEAAVAMGAAEEQPLCPCPDDKANMEVEFKLEDLLAVADEMEMGEPTAQEDLAMSMDPTLGGEAPMPMPGMPMPGEEEEEEEEDLMNMLGEDLDIDDDLLEAVLRDMSAQPTGWAVHPGDAVPTTTMEYEEDLEKAGQMDEEEESDPEKDALDHRLAESLKRFQELDQASKTLVEANKKHKTLILQMKEKLEEVNLSNARLLYINRILNSPSLNERQKSKIVDSIQKSDSIEEAKVIFETLQSAVGSPKRRHESLNEAIKRPSTTMPRRRSVNSKRETAVKDRFQRLAGISQK